MRRPEATRIDSWATAACGLLLIGTTALLSGSGCAPTLYARNTLEGHFVPVEALGALRPGLTEYDVRALLGEPFEIRNEDELIVWRYFERVQPRWCDGGRRSQERPEYTVEAFVTFRDGLVSHYKVNRSGAPQTPEPAPGEGGA